jgi:ABC-type branched-subunit amino acid transport system substrate-binding protein
MEKNSQELVGKRVELIYMNDDQAPEPGTKGIIRLVDDMGTLHVQWDNGSHLGLIPEEDKYRIL